jgi:hypothetical protein
LSVGGESSSVNQITRGNPALFPLPEETAMKSAIATVLAASMLLSATTAYAGGPVVIEDEVEVVAEKPASSIGILPLLLIPIILCIALCGSDDDEPTPQ